MWSAKCGKFGHRLLQKGHSVSSLAAIDCYRRVILFSLAAIDCYRRVILLVA